VVAGAAEAEDVIRDAEFVVLVFALPALSSGAWQPRGDAGNRYGQTRWCDSAFQISRCDGHAGPEEFLSWMRIFTSNFVAS